MVTDSDNGETLIADPAFPWPDGDPYAILNARLVAGGGKPLGPNSTLAEVRDAWFDIQLLGQPGPQERPAWDRLRVVEKRLVIDFFHYRLPRIDLTPLLDCERPPPPVQLPDPADLVAEHLLGLEQPMDGEPVPIIPVDWQSIDVGGGIVKLQPVTLPPPRLEDMLEAEHE